MNAWMYVAGWVLVHFVWQGAAIAIAAACALRLCHNQSASVRYAIACGAMMAMLLGAVATGAIVGLPPVTVEAASVSSRATAKGTIDVFLPIQIHETPSPDAVSTGQRVEAVLPWIVSAWLFGVSLLLARAAGGWWCVRRLHQLARASMCSNWQAAGNRIASRLGLASVIHIVELPQVDVPLVVGCLRPIVVLPIAALSSLHAAQVEAILAHELAHIRRHDYFVNLMQTLAETLLFYHPAVWWLSARIRDEREHCCDDVAIAVCGDPVGYAAALAELEAWRSGALVLAAAATGGSLLNRVRRILRVQVSDDSRTSSWTLGLVILAVVTGLTFNVVAQTNTPAEPKLTFEVASVRLNTSGTNQVTMGMQPGGRFTAVNMPLALLIRSAYRIQESQLIGAPDWVATERYDIVAKGEGEFGPPVPGGGLGRQQLMLQSLLEERFTLKPRRETRQLPIYALVLAHENRTLGPALKLSAVDCQALAAARKQGAAPPAPPKAGERPQCGTHMGFGRIAGGMPMTSLARLLSDVVQRSVVDSTGLTGNFDLELSWTPDQLPSRPPGTPADQPFRMNGVEIDPNGPSIFTALQEQLGLKLESRRGPVEVLVIDQIERPTPD
jgi:uncharacterized protein (TIGR03435 family)